VGCRFLGRLRGSEGVLPGQGWDWFSLMRLAARISAMVITCGDSSFSSVEAIDPSVIKSVASGAMSIIWSRDLFAAEMIWSAAAISCGVSWVMV
jgi:hypothetical protein